MLISPTFWEKDVTGGHPDRKKILESRRRLAGREPEISSVVISDPEPPKCITFLVSPIVSTAKQGKWLQQKRKIAQDWFERIWHIDFREEMIPRKDNRRSTFPAKQRYIIAYDRAYKTESCFRYHTAARSRRADQKRNGWWFWGRTKNRLLSRQRSCTNNKKRESDGSYNGCGNNWIIFPVILPVIQRTFRQYRQSWLRPQLQDIRSGGNYLNTITKRWNWLQPTMGKAGSIFQDWVKTGSVLQFLQQTWHFWRRMNFRPV